MPLLQKCIERPVAVSMAMLVIVVTGIYAALHLPLELTPKAELPKLSVSTVWPNASPEAVEAFITSPVEGVAAALPGVQKIASTSRDDIHKSILNFRPQDSRMDFTVLKFFIKLKKFS